MANWGNSFAQGLSDGWKFGSMYRDRKREEELAAFAKERQAGIGKQDVSDQVNAYDAKNNKELNDIFGAGTSEELGQPTNDRHFIDPKARPDHVAAGPVYDRRQFYDDMAGKAYGMGMPDRGDKFYEAADRQEEFGLRKRALEGQLSDADYQRTQREALNNFGMAIQEAKANGAELDIDGMLQIANRYGVNPMAAQDQILRSYNLDTAVFNANKSKRERAALEAAVTGGLPAMKKLFNEHPMFADGTTFDYAQGKKGGIVVTKYGKDGKPVYTSQEVPQDMAVAYLLQQASDPVSAFKFGLEVEKHNSAMAKDRATIGYLGQLGAAAGARDNAAGLQRDVFNSYYAAVKEENPGISEAQARVKAYAKMRDDYSQRDLAPVKGPTMDDVYKIEERLAMSVRGWDKASPEERKVLVDRELARFFPRQVGAPSGGDEPVTLFAEEAQAAARQRGLPPASDRFLPLDDGTGTLLRARADALFKDDRDRAAQARRREELRRQLEEARGVPSGPATVFDRLNRQQRGGGF